LRRRGNPGLSEWAINAITLILINRHTEKVMGRWSREMCPEVKEYLKRPQKLETAGNALAPRVSRRLLALWTP
jgi:hypothetical protein